MEISTTTAPSSSRCSTNCTLLGKPVGFRCLASLLGVGGARLQRKAVSGPDLRFGKKQHRSQPGTWTVDGFLQVAYDAVAETLPDELFVSTLAIKLTTGGIHVVKPWVILSYLLATQRFSYHPSLSQVC